MSDIYHNTYNNDRFRELRGIVAAFTDKEGCYEAMNEITSTAIAICENNTPDAIRHLRELNKIVPSREDVFEYEVIRYLGPFMRASKLTAPQQDAIETVVGMHGNIIDLEGDIREALSSLRMCAHLSPEIQEMMDVLSGLQSSLKAARSAFNEPAFCPEPFRDALIGANGKPFLEVNKHSVGQIRPPAKPGDAGFDLSSALELTIEPGETGVIDTDVFVAIPSGHVGLIKERSSVGVNGVFAIAGVIDSGYRGPIKIVLMNGSDIPFHIEPGQYVAQMVIVPCVTSHRMVPQLSQTERGANGFGSTGK